MKKYYQKPTMTVEEVVTEKFMADSEDGTGVQNVNGGDTGISYGGGRQRSRTCSQAKRP